jgi:hypothetical protein
MPLRWTLCGLVSDGWWIAVPWSSVSAPLGVPVLTLPGRTMVARIGAALTIAAGLDELVMFSCVRRRALGSGVMSEPHAGWTSTRRWLSIWVKGRRSSACCGNV